MIFILNVGDLSIMSLKNYMMYYISIEELKKIKALKKRINKVAQNMFYKSFNARFVNNILYFRLNLSNIKGCYFQTIYRI